MRNHKHRLFQACVVVMATDISLARAQPPSIVALEIPPGTIFPAATDVNGDGTVVAGSYSIQGAGVSTYKRPLRWTRTGGTAGIGNLGTGSFPTGISADGNILVGISQTPQGAYANYRGFRWTAATGMQELPTPVPNYPVTHAMDISADGSIVIGYANPFHDEGPVHQLGVRWTQAGSEDLGRTPGSVYARPTRISGDGKVIIGICGYDTVYDYYDELAAVWTAETGMQLFPQPAGTKELKISEVNYDGSVLVGYYVTENFRHGFRWSRAEGFVDIGSPAGAVGGTDPTAVSGNGAIVVGNGMAWTRSTGNTLLSSFFTQHGIDLTNWIVSKVTNISLDGRTVVGSGYYNGVQRAWIAYLGDNPCPADLSGEGMVDDVDFVQFAAAYSDLSCAIPSWCPGDLNRDQLVDDSDFVLFAAAYEALLCP